jgi:hypothetical protein
VLCEWLRCGFEQEFSRKVMQSSHYGEARIRYCVSLWVNISDTKTEGRHGISDIEFYVSDMLDDVKSDLMLGVFVAQGKWNCPSISMAP